MRAVDIEFALPGPVKKKTEILALGHSDTVWPIGTLAQMPFREAEGRLWGPGVLDMKSGIAFFIFAARTLRELDIPVRSRAEVAALLQDGIISPAPDGSLHARAPLTRSTILLAITRALAKLGKPALEFTQCFLVGHLRRAWLCAR